MNIFCICFKVVVFKIDLSTARPKWRFDGPALSGHQLYSLVNHVYANRKSLSPSPIIGQLYYNGAIWLSYYNKYSGKQCVNHEDQDRRACCQWLSLWRLWRPRSSFCVYWEYISNFWRSSL